MPANQPGLTSGNGIGSGAVCLWKGERGLVPGVSLDMRMDALEGAKASILSTKPIIVQLHHKYSGWHLFLAMLDSFLQSSGWGSSSSTAAAGSASPYGSFTPGSISSSSSSSSVSSEYQVDWNSSQHPSKELVTLVLHLLKRVLVFADRPFFHHFMAHLGEFPSPTINGIEPAYIVTLFNRVLSRCCQIGGDVSSSSNSSGSNGGGYVSASGGSSSAMDNQPATALLTACVDTISMFLGSYPELIWMHLRHEPFMPPLFIGMDDGIDPPGSFWGSSGSIGSGSYLYQTTGYLQQVILPYEKSVGKYTTTLSFLHLVFKLIDEAQRQSSLVAPTSSSTTTSLSSSSSSPSSSSDLNRVKTQVLMSCLSFIHSDIFPTYNNWRYTNISEKFEIGLKVVVIFNMIMRDTSVGKRERECVFLCLNLNLLSPSLITIISLVVLSSWKAQWISLEAVFTRCVLESNCSIAGHGWRG